MNPPILNDEILSELGEEFSLRLRAGELPSVQEYIDRYPEQAAEISEFLESIAMVEGLKLGPKSKPAQPARDRLPADFGRYKIEHCLGEGGMGSVYLAEDSQLHRKVAIKTPKFHKAEESVLIERFYREARSAATLQHPNICPVYDVGKHDGIHYISMAYIDGRPLSNYVRGRKQLPALVAVRIIRKVALALQEAHRCGVLHRDLKPGNIMIDRNHEPIVMDFGLACQVGMNDSIDRAGLDSLTLDKAVESRLTQDGTMVGSPGYVSPETISGRAERVGPASDVYSLGVVLFELLTGVLPFKGDGKLGSIIREVLTSETPDVRDLRPELDPQLASVCRKAMSRRAADRYGSMEDFADQLTKYLKTTQEVPSALPEVGPTISESLVRAREQCELARSLYGEGQFTASVTILEKMTAESDESANPFVEWAQAELPKARARASESNALQAAQTTQTTDWIQTESAPIVSGFSSQPDLLQPEFPVSPQQKSGLGKPFWVGAIATVSVLLACLLIVIVTSLINEGGRENQVADSTDQDLENQTKTNQPNSDQPNSKASSASSGVTGGSKIVDRPRLGNLKDKTTERNPNRKTSWDQSDMSSDNARSPVQRALNQFDKNKDGYISRDELDPQRMPARSPVRKVAENFDRFDRRPQDGKLGIDEIRRMVFEMSRRAQQAADKK